MKGLPVLVVAFTAAWDHEMLGFA